MVLMGQVVPIGANVEMTLIVTRRMASAGVRMVLLANSAKHLAPRDFTARTVIAYAGVLLIILKHVIMWMERVIAYQV